MQDIQPWIRRETVTGLIYVSDHRERRRATTGHHGKSGDTSSAQSIYAALCTFTRERFLASAIILGINTTATEGAPALTPFADCACDGRVTPRRVAGISSVGSNPFLTTITMSLHPPQTPRTAHWAAD